MAKRKKEIKKRKKIMEGDRQDESLRDGGPVHVREGSGDAGPGRPGQAGSPGAGPPVQDSPMAAAPAARKPAEKRDAARDPSKVKAARDSWAGRNKENFLLGLLILYVLLLGLGTVGELLEIEWILNLPLFR